MMNAANTIKLACGKGQYKSLPETGDTILGLDCEPKTLKMWPVEEKEDAVKALAEKRCRVEAVGGLWRVEEYGLLYVVVDEDYEDEAETLGCDLAEYAVSLELLEACVQSAGRHRAAAELITAARRGEELREIRWVVEDAESAGDVKTGLKKVAEMMRENLSSADVESAIDELALAWESCRKGDWK